MTTGSDNNAGAWVRASAISYCRGRPLHGHLTGGRRTSSPRTAREQAEPWRRCLVTLLGGVPGQIRRIGLGRRPITGSGLCPLLRQGPHRTGRPAGRPSDDGGTSGHNGAGRGGSRRGTAGNGRERLGRSPRTLPSISRSIGWAACRPRLHSPGQLRASTLEVAAAAGVGYRHLTVAIDGRDLGCRRASCRCRDLHGHGRAAGWPVESAALSARPVVVVNVDGPGYEPSPVPAAALADGAACHARPEEAGKRADVLPALGPPAPGAGLESTEASAPSCDR